MVETKELIELKVAVTEAIKTSKRLDKCHETYLQNTHGGFSRAATTTFNANAASLAVALKSELETVKEAAKKVLGI